MFPQSLQLLQDLRLALVRGHHQLGLDALLQLSNGVLVTQTDLLGIVLLRVVVGIRGQARCREKGVKVKIKVVRCRIVEQTVIMQV